LDQDGDAARTLEIGSEVMKSSELCLGAGDGFAELLAEIVNAVPGCLCEIESDEHGGVKVTEFCQDERAFQHMTKALEADPRFNAYWEAYEETLPADERLPSPRQQAVVIGRKFREQ
jgi:hypothetical protein